MVSTVGSLGKVGMDFINEDDEEDIFGNSKKKHSSSFQQEQKYNPNNSDDFDKRKYKSVTRNNRMFKHHGYKIKRRFSSHVRTSIICCT